MKYNFAQQGVCSTNVEFELDGDIAVSYTHLDVYKRQACIRPAYAAPDFA